MKIKTTKSRVVLPLVMGMMFFGGLSAGLFAADPDLSNDAVIQKQIAELRAKVAELEARTSTHAAPQTPPMAPMPGKAGPGPGMRQMQRMPMPGMGTVPQMQGMNMPGMQGMGGMMDQMGMMKGMQGMDMMMMMDMMKKMKGMEMMGMMGEMGGMGGMNNMPVMNGMSPSSSALPGFAGASHLYHIGATGFFLDHPEHITLTTDQEASLNKIKEQTSLAQGSFDRKIAEGEQQVWQLTASDQPSAEQIEAKVKEVENFKTEKRLAFIRSVGEAAKLLTDQQRKVLTGFADPKSDKADPAHQHASPSTK